MGKSKKSKSIIWIVVGVIAMIILIGIIVGSSSNSKLDSTKLIENQNKIQYDSTEKEIENNYIEMESEIQNKPANGADASDGKVHLWLLNNEKNNEKCKYFLDANEECRTFKIRVQNESGDDVLSGNFFSWSGWIGDEGIRAHGADGADKLKNNGTTEVDVYFITGIGQKITEIVFEYGLFNEVVLPIENN